MAVEKKTDSAQGAKLRSRTADSQASGAGAAEIAEATETTGLLSAEAGSSDDAAQSLPDRWDGMDDFKDLPWWRTPSVYWLLGPFFLFTLAFGGALVPKINLILSLICKQHFSDSLIENPDQTLVPIFVGGDNPQCRIPEVQTKVAEFTLIMNLLTGLLSAVVTPEFGQLSDRYGRTKLMALASCGGVLAEIITLLAARFPDSVDYRWLILGSVFDGMTGSFIAGNMLTQSYTSDCTPPSRRAVAIGFVQACLFTGLALGPLLAGFLVKWTGSLVTVFYVIVACHIVFILFIGFVVPDSVSQRRRQATQYRRFKEWETRLQTMGTWLSRIQSANPFEKLRILWPSERGTSTQLRLNMVSLAISDMIIVGSSIAAGPMIILYSQSQFKWGTFESSIFVSAISLVRTGFLLIVFPIVNYFGRVRPAQRRKALGLPAYEANTGADAVDIWVIRIAVASEVVACTGYSLAPDGRTFFASGMLAASGGLGSATIQAVMTKHVPAGKTGQVLGAVGMLHAMARVVGPVMFNGIYAATTRTLPQAFLMVLTGFFVIALICAIVLKPRVYWEEEESEDEETEPLTPGETILGSNAQRTLPIDEDQIAILM